MIAEDINRTRQSPTTPDFGVRRDRPALSAKSRKAEGSAWCSVAPNAVGSVVTFAGLQASAACPSVEPVRGRRERAGHVPNRNDRHRGVQPDFVQRGKLTGLIEALSADVRFVWLEDIRASFRFKNKIRAKIDAMFRSRLPGARADASGQAVVLFTSGSEGNPKGSCSATVTFWRIARSVIGDRFQRRRHRIRCDADVSLLRPDRRDNPASGVRRAEHSTTRAHCITG